MTTPRHQLQINPGFPPGTPDIEPVQWETIANKPAGLFGTVDHAIVHKETNETVNGSAVLQDDNELFLDAGAAEAWGFTAVIFYSSSVTADFQCGWSGPAGALMDWQSIQNIAPAAPTAILAIGSTVTSAGIGAGTVVMLMLHGEYRTTAGSPGRFTFRWAQASGEASDTIVYNQSHIIAHRLRKG